MKNLILILMLIGFDLKAQVTLTNLSDYTENFNSLGSAGTTLSISNGWVISEGGANANNLYRAGSGTSSTGDTYSFGSSSIERALGGLMTSTLIPSYGVQLINNTGGDLNLFTINYTGEQWRRGNATSVDRIDFQYSTDATALNNGNWIDVDVLDFSSPNSVASAGALDGNASGNRTQLSGSFSVSVAQGSSLWIRFTDFDATGGGGADDALSVDDFSIQFAQIPEPSIMDMLVFLTTLLVIIGLTWRYIYERKYE